MKTIKMLEGRLVDGAHRNPGELVLVPDDVAAMMVRGKVGEEASAGPVANPEANALAEAVHPLVPDAQPRQAADALGLKDEDHPGLMALKAVETPGAPKRAGRGAPADKTA